MENLKTAQRATKYIVFIGTDGSLPRSQIPSLIRRTHLHEYSEETYIYHNYTEAFAPVTSSTK
jgi:hypothetical protein